MCHNRDYNAAIQSLESLTNHTPLQNNHYLLQELATAYTLNGDYEEATGPLQLVL